MLHSMPTLLVSLWRTPMVPKPRPKPEHWSLDKAKRESAHKTFDQSPPKLPEPKARGDGGKFVPSKGQPK